MNISYRRATADEVDVIALIWDRANAQRTGAPIPDEAGTDTAGSFRDRLAADGVVAVLGEDDGVPVACCFASALWDQDPTRPGAHVSAVAVAPERWGEGLGSGVVSFLERELAHGGYAFAQLHVLETNTRARDLYERLGWVLVRLGDPHHEGPQAVFEKELIA